MRAGARAVIGTILGLAVGLAVKPAAGQLVPTRLTGCQDTPWVGVAGAIGQSTVDDAYVTHASTDPAVFESLQITGGSASWSARADLGLVGPLRARVTASATSLPVDLRSYVQGDDPSHVASTRRGQVGVQSILAGIGLQHLPGQPGRGRRPCGYALFGGGDYRLSYSGATVHRGGVFADLGMDFPATDRGAVQIGLQLHAINTRQDSFVSSSTVLMLAFSVGWMQRF